VGTADPHWRLAVGVVSYIETSARQAMVTPHLALERELHPQSSIMLGPLPPPATSALRRRCLAVFIALLGVLPAGAVRADTPYELELPRGFPRPRIPAENPLTWEKVELGRFLFYDTRLSLNQTQACASCHRQDKAFTDGLARAVGSTGQLHPRSSMSLANVAYAGTLGWANPGLFRLEKQAEIPLFGTDPIELGMSGKEQELFARLSADLRYQRMFAEAYPGEADPVNLATILAAIASFERTLLSGNSAYDRYVFGLDDDAISPAAKRGSDIFFTSERHECFHCHLGFNLTNSLDSEGREEPQVSFHNTALYNVRCSDFGLPELDLVWCESPPGPEECANTPDQALGCHCDGPGPQDMGCYPRPNTGAYEVSHLPQDMGAFKAPSLRNVAVTAPYMHDGSIATLEEVLDHYAAGGRTVAEGPNAGVGSESPAKGAFVRGFDLTEQDRADLLEFLKSLTDDEFLTNPRYSDPFAPVACPGDCDLDGVVAVNELVTSINVSLGDSSLARCVVSDPSGDGRVTVSELVSAIRRALDGCG
jgi:cytochrome c peroxidase